MTQMVKAEGPSLPELVNLQKPELRRLLPDYDRFTRVLLTEIRRTPKLAECEPHSFLAAAFLTAQLGLEPGPLGEAWLIPRWNGKLRCNEATFLLGYRGIEKLALRSGRISSIETRTVYEGDEFEVAYGAEPRLVHVPRFESNVPKLWYAVARRPDGPPLIQVLTPDDVAARRASSSTPDKGPWRDHFDAMARKSCVRALWQNLPLEARDPTLDRALEVDDTVPDQSALRPITGPDQDEEEDQGDDVIDVEPEDVPAARPAAEESRTTGGDGQQTSPATPPDDADDRLAAAIDRANARATAGKGPTRDVGDLLNRAWAGSQVNSREVKAWIGQRLAGAPVPDQLSELPDDVWNDLEAWVAAGCPKETSA